MMYGYLTSLAHILVSDASHIWVLFMKCACIYLAINVRYYVKLCYVMLYYVNIQYKKRDGFLYIKNVL